MDELQKSKTALLNHLSLAAKELVEISSIIDGKTSLAHKNKVNSLYKDVQEMIKTIKTLSVFKENNMEKLTIGVKLSEQVASQKINKQKAEKVKKFWNELYVNANKFNYLINELDSLLSEMGIADDGLSQIDKLQRESYKSNNQIVKIFKSALDKIGK